MRRTRNPPRAGRLVFVSISRGKKRRRVPGGRSGGDAPASRTAAAMAEAEPAAPTASPMPCPPVGRPSGPLPRSKPEPATVPGVGAGEARPAARPPRGPRGYGAAAGAVPPQAVAAGFVPASEWGRLRFVAAAEHAQSVGAANPCGLFVRLVRGGLLHYATEDDTAAASVRLRRHLYGRDATGASAGAAGDRAEADAGAV